jgi:hypothetical protein
MLLFKEAANSRGHFKAAWTNAGTDHQLGFVCIQIEVLL